MNSEKNSTLIILTPGFPGSESDTVCLPMQQSLVRAIKKNYPQLNIIILSFQYPYHSQTYTWFDTTVISFNGKNKGGLSRLLLRRKLMATLKDISHGKNIAGILSFWYGECAWAGKKFAGKNNNGHYCWMLGQDAKKGNKYVKNINLAPNELIALSDFLQDEFEKNYGTRPRWVMPPGIDPTQFSNPGKEKDIDIIAAGSLIPLKQYEIFVKVIAEIKKHIPGIKVMLIGDGPEKNKLKKLVGDLGLGANIVFAGELSHPEVLVHMQRGRIFLHTSAYEGFGVVNLEALHAGCHVISFCKPMKKDIEHWHIVSNQEEMTEKTLKILQKNIIYKSVTPFSMDDTAKKLMGLFSF
ncbi:MAG TPA: glycosyltransferase family 4 protein [Ferruginibacter sp.]|nr:glycosyltransferase family 4 protein [Ferruginibacter sp.]